jgi:hypothetical protein
VPFRPRELGMPFLVEPARAEGVCHGRQQRHVFAPPGLAAQADAVDVAGLVCDLCRRRLDEVPGRFCRHGQPGLIEQVAAIHEHRTLAIERRSIEFAVRRQAGPDRRQQIVDIIAGAKIVERHQPVLLRPDRHFVGADRRHVELAALGGDVGGDLLAQRVFLERHPVEFDARVLGAEIIRQLLHSDHVAVIDGRW